MNRGPKKKYSCNEKYFDCIDSRSKSYFLGLIYADGHVNNLKRYFRIELKESDKIILQRFKIDIEYTGNILFRPAKNINWSSSYVLHITSERLRNSLQLLGLTNNKSQTITVPNIPFISDFFRGYFDGDGCCSVSKNGSKCLHILSNEKFVMQMKDIIKNQTGVVMSSLERKSVYTLAVSSKKNIQKLYDWMYTDTDLYLPRKKNKVLEALQLI